MESNRSDGWEVDSLISLKVAREMFPQKPTWGTVRRWCIEGCVHPLDRSRRVILESRFSGSRDRFTTREAVERFKAKLNSLD